MIDNVGITATPETLREQVRIWLQSLSSMRVLGEENYRVEWQRVERAYDYLRLLDIDGMPAEPPKPDKELAIADIIAALQPVEDFLRRYVDDKKATEAELEEYRAPGEEPLTVAFVKDRFGWDGSVLSRNVNRIDNPDGRGHLYHWKSLIRYGRNRGVDVEAEYAKWQSSHRQVCK